MLVSVAVCSAVLHIAQPTFVEVLCDVLRKEVEEAITSNVGLCGAPSVCVRGDRTRVHVLHTPFRMQGQYFQQRSYLGHALTPSPMFVKSKKDPLGLKRYAAYVAISGFPQLTYSSVMPCHVSHADLQCIGRFVWLQ